MSARDDIARCVKVLRSGASERIVIDLDTMTPADRAEHYEAIEVEIARPGRRLRVFREGAPLVYVIQAQVEDRRR